MNPKNVKLFLAMAAFGAALVTPASASTISVVVSTGGKATFASGVLTSVSGWNVLSFAGSAATAGDVTVTVSGGNLLFSALAGAFTGALSDLNGAGAFLTIALPTASGLSGTQPSLTEQYGAGTAMLSAAAAADLSVTTALMNNTNNFSTNTCSSGCSGTTPATTTGVFNVSSNTNSYTVTATPEPASFFLLGAGLLMAGVLFKSKALVQSSAAKQI